MRTPALLVSAVICAMSFSAAYATESTLLAEKSGFLLGNAHRCGVPTGRVARTGKVVGQLIAATADDEKDADQATSRFAEVFLISSQAGDVRNVPVCKMVINEFQQLEQHQLTRPNMKLSER